MRPADAEAAFQAAKRDTLSYEPHGPDWKRIKLQGPDPRPYEGDQEYRGITGLLREYSPAAANVVEGVKRFAGRGLSHLMNDPGLQYLPGPQAVELAGQRFLNPAKLTGQRVLREAAKGPGKFGGFAKFVEANPTAGEDLFDLPSAVPAISGRAPVPRLDPTIPPRQGISARMLDAFNNPKVTEGIQRFIGEGHQKMPQDWYATSPLWKKYQEVWGDLALPKFERDMGYSSATSSGMRVPDNIRTGSYYSYLDEQGLKFPKKPAPGYGAKLQKTHREGAVEVRDTGAIDPFANPKRASYKENLMGNEDALTGDRHFMRMVGMLSEDPRFLKGSTTLESGAKMNPREMFYRGELTMEDALKRPDYWEDTPGENEYMHAENAFRKIANTAGYTTGNAQGKAWVGAGEMTGLGSPPEPWMKLYAQRVAYTAARLGADPKVVLEKVIRGEIPLLEIGAIGAAGLGGMNAESTRPRSGNQMR